MKKCCLLCKYWSKQDSSIIGICKRYPPIPVGKLRKYKEDSLVPCALSVWPITNRTEYCGEYKKEKNK